MKKYAFNLIGYTHKASTRSEKDYPLRLEEVVVVADAPVLRAIAEFFLQCADGIEKYGEQWDHEHFRDDWKEWYSAYPDIIVNRSR